MIIVPSIFCIIGTYHDSTGFQSLKNGKISLLSPGHRSSKELQPIFLKTMKISPFSIWRIKTKAIHKPERCKKKRGEMPKLSKAQKLSVTRAIRSSPTLTASDLVADLSLPCSKRTVVQYFDSTGFQSLKHGKISLLSSGHWLKRHKFVLDMTSSRAYLTAVVYLDEKSSLWTDSMAITELG
jgi:hypothetical protein